MIKVSNLTLYFLISTLLVFISACSNVDAVQDNNVYIVKAKNAVKKHNLTKIPLSCLNFKLEEEKFEGKVMVDVREIHNAECGGDPETSPRLFSIAIDELKNEVWSDANSLLGQMEKLKWLIYIEKLEEMVFEGYVFYWYVAFVVFIRWYVSDNNIIKYLNKRYFPLLCPAQATAAGNASINWMVEISCTESLVTVEDKVDGCKLNTIIISGGSEKTGHSAGSFHSLNKAIDVAGMKFNKLSNDDVLVAARNAGFTHGVYEDFRGTIRDHWHLQIGAGNGLGDKHSLKLSKLLVKSY